MRPFLEARERAVLSSCSQCVLDVVRVDKASMLTISYAFARTYSVLRVFTDDVTLLLTLVISALGQTPRAGRAMETDSAALGRIFTRLVVLRCCVSAFPILYVTGISLLQGPRACS